MFDRKVIDKNIQETLFKRINASKRNEFSSDDDAKKFFQGTSLDANQNNPFSEHLVKNCFAKVSVAYPSQKDKDSPIVRQPYSLSSYLNQDNFDQSGEDTTGIQNQYAKSISYNKDVPLTFQQGYEEDSKNRFRGHSGITKISVAQQEYYTYKFTIDWVCPDPVYFDEKFEPRFLQMGAYCAIEFGWGIEDKDFNVPALTIEEMNNLLKSNQLRERNLNSRGNYYCGVGVVTKFDWKIASDGSYTGTLEVITPGASNLLQTNQDAKNSGGTIASQKVTNTLELIQITKELIESEKIKLDDEEKQEFLESFNTAQKVSQKIKENSLTFSIVMRNFDKVVDKWIDNYDKDKKNTNNNDISDRADDRYLLNLPKRPDFDFDFDKEFDKNIGTALEYKYHKGALNIKIKEPKEVVEAGLQFGNTGVTEQEADEAAEAGVGGFKARSWPVQDHLKNRYFVNWGWFEDNILNPFYSMTSNNEILQEVKSSISDKDNQDKDNQCFSSPYLYSMGLDSVILPKKMHPILQNGFKSFIGKTKKAPYSDDSGEIITDSSIEDRNSIAKYYSREQRIRMNRIYKIFEKIDKFFPGFESQRAVMQEDDENTPDDESRLVETPGKGTIRNMVFPTQMFVKHFSNSPSLRQGLRNFWADVNNQYGRYWKFDIGEDLTKNGRVGVFDKNFVPDASITFKKPISTEGDPTKMFVFEIFSNNSIVKSFDVQLKMSEEAAVLARYGTFTKAGSGTVKADGKKDLGLEAWNIINSRNELRSEILKKELIDRYKKTKDMSLDNLEIENEFKEFYRNIAELQDDFNKNEDLVNNDIKVYLKGIGLYNSRGELSSYFRQTMLYLINYARMKDSKSLIEVSQPILPVELTMTLDGIGGLEVGNCFKVDYLPQIYRDYCYFMINKVDHSISKTGWETTITAVMIADLPTFWQESGRKLGEGLKNYIELFELTTDLNINDKQQLELLFTEQSNSNTDKYTKLYNNNKKTILTTLQSVQRKAKQIKNKNEINVGQYTIVELNPAVEWVRVLNTYFDKLIETYEIANQNDTIKGLYENHIELLQNIDKKLEEIDGETGFSSENEYNPTAQRTYNLWLIQEAPFGLKKSITYYQEIFDKIQ